MRVVFVFFVFRLFGDEAKVVGNNECYHSVGNALLLAYKLGT